MDDLYTVQMDSTLNVTTTFQPTIPLIYTSQTHVEVIASLTITIGILGIVGNLMVFLAVALSKGLQNSTNVFVVSLSISDFISAITLPFQGASVLSESGWPFRKGLCDLLGALFIWTNSTSILTITAIAVNRYIIITKTIRVQQRIYTHCGNTLMVALLWTFPFLVLVTPQLIPATGDIVYNPVYRLCIWDLEHPSAIVFQSIGSVIFISCSVIIAYCYAAIYRFVRRHVKKTENTLRESSENLEMTDQTNRKKPPKGPSIKQINITKNLAVVVVVFSICVLPYTLNLYVPLYSLYTAYLAVLVVLPNCLNPMIYAARHPLFKVVFKCMLTCRFRDIPHPSEWLKALLHNTGSANRTSQSSSTV
ncbi:beta-4C adrenergic receptor-like [Lytechinus pictus]|uniref:beta-4C adrenergic receptor-like n=1 Tax=Lytechinus pictus TaxID=7653 RepID=UPI0030B9FC92